MRVSRRNKPIVFGDGTTPPEPLYKRIQGIGENTETKPEFLAPCIECPERTARLTQWPNCAGECSDYGSAKERR